MADHLKEFTNATAVYCGKHVVPMNAVGDGDDDTAHLNADAQKIILFGQSTEGHEYIIDKQLTQDQGLTFDVFKDPEAPAEGEAKAADAVPVNVVIPEVCREPRMHYFKVPRLGSYMAIRLEYKSCLNEKAFDEGVAEMQRV